MPVQLRFDQKQVRLKNKVFVFSDIVKGPYTFMFMYSVCVRVCESVRV